ncbi:hypothetical protein [Streptomyces sp. KMM 9044]|uniref:hypothetical protein n=1 Tax=Streptomyces sp. KMM 9044 TaxID=2744474 RepID=UPI0021518422|nr:hypothetical protein [Streptomyces sp. KMM 9044]WAX81268.1 hypothetical protein HUV60_030060 [Streptomyces sp. KMM 9044]
MSMLLLHLRSSVLRWWILPLLLLDLAVLFLRTDYWIGVWPETGAAAQMPAYFLSLAATSAAAWISGARARRNLDEQLSVSHINPLRIEAWQLVSVLVIVFVPYLVGAAAAAAVTLPQGAPGIGQFFAYVALGAAGLILSIGWGWMLGRILSGRFAALVALLSWLIAGFALGDTTGLLEVSGPPTKEVSVYVVALRCILAMVFCACLLALPSRVTRATMRRPLPLAVVSVVTLGMVTMLLGAQPVSERAVPRSAPCIQGKVQVCYWPEHEKYVPLMEKIATRAETLPATFVLPKRLNEYGLERHDVRVNGVLHRQVGGDFTIAEGSIWSLAFDFSIAISSETLKECNWDRARAAQDDRKITSVEHWLEVWLAGGGSPNYQLEGNAPIAKARAVGARIAETKSEKEQFAWASEELDEFRANYC